MIPAQIVSDVALLSASVQAAAPLRQASPILKSALVRAGRSLIQEIDAAIPAALGNLDVGDPAPTYAGNLAGYLTDLSTSAYDQASLVDIRGSVGRRVFNLAQGQ